MKKLVRRHQYKIPKYRMRHPIGRPLPELKWYWGSDEEWGWLSCIVRTETTPHLTIHKVRKRCSQAYRGWDYERNRFVIRSWNDGGFINIGWRKKVYG